VDRTASIGNAVVPQCAEWLGERILKQKQQETQKP
jgi:site-specific DNA-cytosine methylase